jgi:hypothetical protein
VRGGVRELAQVFIGDAKRSFGLLLVLDIGSGAKPLEDVPVVIAHGTGPCQEPAIRAVAAAEPHLGVERLCGGGRAAPCFLHGRGIFGVDEREPAVAEQL